MDGRSLKKCFIQLFLSKLSRDSDSGGYGVTLLGTKTSSCEGLRIFEESLVISFLCSIINFFVSFELATFFIIKVFRYMIPRG